MHITTLAGEIVYSVGVCHRGWKGVDRMDERKEGKKESPIPMLILLAIIGLGAIFLVVFVLFGE